MDKAYNEIVFKNDQSPDLDETNMNAISHGLSVVDDRVIALKGDLTELNNDLAIFETSTNVAINNEKSRAIAEEKRIENLFVMPTQEAVSNWLDEHPEATTTVQDNSITANKLTEEFRKDIEDVININQNYTPSILPLINHGQDSAIYGNMLFDFEGNSGVYRIYNIDTNELVATKSLGTTGQIRPHVNSAIFGKKENEGDAFPLLYVSGYNGLSETGEVLPRGRGYVYAFDADYNATLKQTIIIDFLNDDIWRNTETRTGAITYGNFITDENYLYVLTSRNSKTRIFTFEIPEISAEVVALSISDVVEYHDLPFYPYLQGMTILDNYLFVLSGINIQLANSSAMHIIDLNTYKQVSYLPLSAYMQEPEAIIVYKNRLLIAQNYYYEIPINLIVNSNNGILEDLTVPNNDNIVDAINSVNDVIVDDLGAYCHIFAKSTVTSTDTVEVAKNAYNAIFERCNKISFSKRHSIVSFGGIITSADGSGYLKADGVCNLFTGAMSMYVQRYMNRSECYYLSYDASLGWVIDDEVTGYNLDTSAISKGYGKSLMHDTAKLGTGKYRLKLSQIYTTFLVQGGYGNAGILKQILGRGAGEPVIVNYGNSAQAYVTASRVDNSTIDITVGASVTVSITANAKFGIEMIP